MCTSRRTCFAVPDLLSSPCRFTAPPRPPPIATSTGRAARPTPCLTCQLKCC
ncbi:unnamed protein product [Chondrus crispus]|uniref:Uncharacterized protein n=1 Tax=Chondrus crispus TaxID=2769 RepID=R7QH12_CHOCR|nr:unnamed protein product [Chondrus crispus]CDF37018.1 unnamed protein product [Chondrus crispus]|eukprot:XP_005716837.1 unnamed protein product [Chondrus crispus]